MPIGKRPLTAAAARVVMGDTVTRKITEEEWEDRAWAVYDRLPEVHQGIQVRANIAQRIRYFAAVVPDASNEPEELTEGAAAEVLENEGGVAMLNRVASEFVTHFDVVGKGYLVARDTTIDESASGILLGDDPGEPDGREWEVVSTRELLRNDDNQLVRVDLVGEQQPIDNENVFQVWRPHPRLRSESDSPLRASLEVAENLVLLGREIRARSMSRIPAGLWALPDSFNFEDPNQDDPQPFSRRLVERMSRPIEDADDAGSLVPWILNNVPDESIADLKAGLIRFDRDWEIGQDLREELIRRLAIGLDLPAELLLGIGGLNHWSAYLVSEAAVSQHVAPTVDEILNSLTKGWFIPLLDAAGVPNAKQFMLWRDLTPAIVPIARDQTTILALTNAVIGYEATRREMGYGEGDAPTTNDLELIAWLNRGRILPPIDLDDPQGTPSTVPPGQGRDDAPQDDTPDPPPQQEASLDRGRIVGLAASNGDSRRDLSELADLDVALLDYVVTQTQAALDRVLEKAGSRLKAKVQGDETLALLVKGLAPQVVATSLVMMGGVAEDHLIFQGVVDDDDFDAVLDRVMARIRRTQEQATDVIMELTGMPVTAEELSAISVDLNEGREALRAVLLAAATAALFRPDGRPDPADLGEAFDTRVPVAGIRGALTVAGGGTATAVQDEFVELVAGGRRVVDMGTERGVSTLSFVWRYGDPAGRVSNFKPHQNLDGTGYTNRQDPVLATAGTGGSWVGAFFRPGDHDGCQCVPGRVVTLSVPGLTEPVPSLA